MLIGIDGNEANIANRVGVNKYAFEIIWGIYRELNKNSNPIRITVYLKNNPLPDMPSATENFKYKILKGGKIWIITKLMPQLYFEKEKPDIFFSPSHYIPPFAPMPRVCSIMDLGYLEFSAQFRKYDFWQLKLWSAWSINVSKYIMTISEATKKDIVRLYPRSKGKIVVSYPGYDEYLTTQIITSSAINDVRKKYSIVKDYILYLGTLKPSKNIEGLIAAFSILKSRKDLQLVIAGKKGWLYESIFNKVKELHLENKVVFTDFIEDRDKFVLIKGAKAFLLPSFWEGFGLDILSAFYLKVPVVASNVGSLPEVVGNAGILVDPNNIQSIADGIHQVLSLKQTDYNVLVEKQKTQLTKFSWKKAAKLTLDTLIK